MKTEQGKIRHWKKPASYLAVMVALLSCPVSATDIDTSRVREKPQEEKDAASAILKAPQFVILLPVTILKGLSEFTIDEIISSRAFGRLLASLGDVDRIWGMYPVVGYTSNKGFKGGLAFTSKQVFTKGERLKIKGSYSTHNYQRYLLRYSAPNKFGLIKRPGITAEYQRRPWESFYGIGNNSHENDEVAFTLEESFFGFGWHHNLLPSLTAHLEGTYRILNIFDGEDPDREGLLTKIRERLQLGADDLQAARLWSAGIYLTHDWRNHPGQPTSGGYESISLSYHQGLNRSDDLQYLRTRIDLHHYLNLYMKRLVAFRILLETIDPIDDSPDLPFYLQPSLGGKDDLRGYRTRRFVDNNLALVSVEYRYPIWDFVDAFLFLDEGRVFDSITDDFTFRGWHYSAGGGLRVWGNSGNVLSVLAAGGGEGSRFYFEFTEGI